jgi:hypothetical protein
MFAPNFANGNAALVNKHYYHYLAQRNCPMFYF